MMISQDLRKKHHDKPLKRLMGNDDRATTLNDALHGKVKKFLPEDYVPSPSKLPANFVDSVLAKAQHPDACLAAAHILLSSPNPGNQILLLDAGAIPRARPSASLPAVKSTSQILMATAGRKLRWVLLDEILGAYGFDPQVVNLSFLAQRSRGMVLVAR